MSKKCKKIWNIFTSIIVVIFMAIAVLLVGVRVVGLKPLCVLSGSMEPTYMTGSLIYVKNADATEVNVGEPITFYLGSDKVVATHRVIEIDKKNQLFYTKGDANKTPDPSPVKFESLIGRPVFTIPYLGYLSRFIAAPQGKYLTMGAMAIAVILIFVPDIMDKGKKSKKLTKIESSD